LKKDEYFEKLPTIVLKRGILLSFSHLFSLSQTAALATDSADIPSTGEQSSRLLDLRRKTKLFKESINRMRDKLALSCLLLHSGTLLVLLAAAAIILILTGMVLLCKRNAILRE
jgi:hypothetical protein